MAASTKSRPSANGTAPAAAIPAPAAPKAEKGSIVIPAPQIQVTHIRIIGERPLIVCAFPDKARQEMRDKRLTQAGSTGKSGRAVRDFQQEFRDSLYPMDDGSGHGFPAIAFKHALVGACRQVADLSMEMAKRLLFVECDGTSKGFGVVRIVGEPTYREDIVRLASQDRPPDIRIRAEFKEWSTTIRVRHNVAMLSVQSLLNLVQYAGLSEGIGENRPSSPKKTGDHGTFRGDFGGNA